MSNIAEEEDWRWEDEIIGEDQYCWTISFYQMHIVTD